MTVRVRDHVLTLTGVLSIGSLLLIFGAVLGFLPTSDSPIVSEAFVEMIPHVNVVLSLCAIVSIALGWYWIRRNSVRRHRSAMLTAVMLFATFLVLYLYRLSVLGGPSPFSGPEMVYRFVYLPLLTVHILFAIVCIPLLYYVLLVGVARPAREISRTNHATVGRFAASLWLTSFTLGILVYVLLHHLW